jgi:predicted nuclease of predicted toxin-antitoxin system
MRILLDECVPRPLRRKLADHDVRTVVEMGWAGKRNGELMQLLHTETFAVFLTTDQNLRYQQNLRGLPMAVIVLVAPTNRLDDLVPLMPQVRTVLATIQHEAVVEVQAS